MSAHAPTPWSDRDYTVTGAAAADAYIAEKAILGWPVEHRDGGEARRQSRQGCVVSIAQAKHVGKEAVATVHGGTPDIAHANAAFIVRAVNAHDDLVDALQASYDVLADIQHQWPGRISRDGQALLCKMRDALASATRRSGEVVSSNNRSEIVRAALANSPASRATAAAVSERDALARLSWDDIHRAMRSYGHTATQEAMRRALVSFLLKRDVHGLHPFTVADGHRPIEARP